MAKTILVTGGAGFIGYHTIKALLARGDKVITVDNFNPYYDPTLKHARIETIKDKIKLYQADIADYDAMKKIFAENKIDQICHLAAQAGVRYSLTDPFSYERSNGLGTLNLLELARHNNIKDFIYASSSSVYGKSKKIPFKETDKCDTPMSLYAATKRYNELQAHCYHDLYGLKTTGLRFFTVYGPYGRPDLSLFKFTKNILENKPIDVYNQGKMKRDFTYVSDIVSGILASLDKAYPCEVFNLGRGQQVDLMEFIELIEKYLGKKAEKNMMPMQPGDVPATHADITKAKKKLGYNPKVSVKEGVKHFIDWYREYYKV